MTTTMNFISNFFQIALEEAATNPALSCPEKAIFLRRPNWERNWRKNNFKVTDVKVVSKKNTSMHFIRNATYKDFHVVHISSFVDVMWTLVWVDFVGKDGIRVGELPKPSKDMEDDYCVCDEVFAVSRTVIFLIYSSYFQSNCQHIEFSSKKSIYVSNYLVS